MKVEQIMSREVHTCGPDDTLEAAARVLWDRDVGVVPIVSEGHAVGMLTDRDVCMAAYTQGRPLHEIRIASVMSRELFGCHADATLDDAARIMGEHQVRRLPVLDAERRLQGLVSLNDLAREAGKPRGRVNPKQVVDLLAAVSAPRKAAPAELTRAPHA